MSDRARRRRSAALPDRRWFRASAEAWPVVAGVLAHPWPEEAVLLDLGWWSDRRAIGDEEIPGWRVLSERWGWTQYATRQIMREVLGDPKTYREPTANLPRTYREPTGQARSKVDNEVETYREPTANLPETYRRPTTRAYGDQTSDTDTDTDKIPEAVQPALPVELPEAPPSASGEGGGSREPDPDSTASRVAAVAAEWWRLWELRRARHPRGAPRSPDLRKVDRQAIQAVVGGRKPKITVDEAITICRWIFYGDDQHARFLRGEREDDQVENEHLNPSAAYKPTKLTEKLTKAQIFVEEHERKRARVARVEADRVPVPTIPDRPTAAPPHIRERMRQRREAKRQAEIEQYGFSMEQI